MNSSSQIEAEMLRLPASDRERLALLAWHSLGEDQVWLADPANDPDGIALARMRDREIENGQVEALSHDEFLRRRAVPANEA